MKKIILITISVLITLGLGITAYAKYEDYKLDNDIEIVSNEQNQKEEKQVINDYNNLLTQYKNNTKVYSSLSNYYRSKNKLDKSVEVLYEGLEKNKDDKLLTEQLVQNIKNAKLEDGYLRITSGSAINSDNKILIKGSEGVNIPLKLNIDTSKINTSKEGFTEIQGKELYTGIDINIGIEVLEFTGNTMANNLNGGSMAYKDGWIYYRDSASKGLYKMKEDMSEQTKLDGSVEPCYINIKDNNLYFIDKNSGQYGSLVMTDLDGKNKKALKRDANYVYIVGEYIYYSMTTEGRNGWNIVSLNKMNLQNEDVEKDIQSSMGSIRVLNSKYNTSTNKYGSFISSEKNQPTWGDAINYKYLDSAEIYKGDIYGNISNASIEKNGFGKLDIEHNTQNVTIDKVDRFNSIGKDIYYINQDGIFMSSIDESNAVKIMDIEEEPYEMQLYSIAGKMYAYSKKIKIVEKQ